MGGLVYVHVHIRGIAQTPRITTCGRDRAVTLDTRQGDGLVVYRTPVYTRRDGGVR